MSETSSEETPASETVPNSVIPHGALPPLTYRDMPESVPLRRMVGPSIILAGLALGSGEFILWPYITYRAGFIFFWACLLGVTTQYFINMEIARWTLATGESAITAFCRLSRHWGWVFLLLNIIPWMLPGWAKGAAQLTSWLIWPQHAGEIDSPYVTELAIGGLFICGIVLTAGPVVYETVEKVQMFLVGLILIAVVVLATQLVRGDAVVAMVQGSVSVGSLPERNEVITWAFLLGALAFAGAGGSLNLGQSNYVKDKGYGMGRHIGRITSPITGQEEALSEIGYHFPAGGENQRRWRAWWRTASVEHFLSFFLTCVVCLALLSLIAYSIYYTPEGQLRAGAGEYGDDLGFIWGEAQAIRDALGPAARYLFLVMGVAILLTTEFGVLDATSRISSDIVKVNWLRESQWISEGRLYYIFLWGTILLGTAILLWGGDAAEVLPLFKLSAAMNGGVMFLYCALLLYVNRSRLPRGVRLSGWRVATIVWAVLFFGFFAVLALSDKLALWFGPGPPVR